MTTNHCEGCAHEGNDGWRINDEGRIERCDTCETFACDAEAVFFVRGELRYAASMRRTQEGIGRTLTIPL
jgi:hypothetical protein